MKQYIVKILSIIFISLSLQSCSDYLILEPQGSLIQQEFWQNKEHVQSAVAGCYASMTNSGYTTKTLIWGELRAEMLVSRTASNNDLNMMKNYILPSNSVVNWSNFYQTINYCNLVLEFSDSAQENDLTFTDAELKALKAEALTIRALTYFILVRNFKELPLVLIASSSNAIDFYPAKNTEEEILAQIIADLELSVEDLPLSYAASTALDKGKFNKGSALTLLADVYLWANQYENSVDACQQVIDFGKYSLVERSEWFNQIFFEGNSSEGIFELQYQNINTTILNYFYPTDGEVTPFGGIVDLYDQVPDDIRGYRGSYEPFFGSAFKFTGVDADSGQLRERDEYYNTFMFYRYADVLLIQAEALLLIDSPDLAGAYDLINQVHNRATGLELENSDISATGLLELVLLERQKEFAFEGKRWYDLLRFDRRNDFADLRILTMAEIKTTADSYEVIISNFTDPEAYFLPIPQSEINLNRNLEQNPYYEY